MDYSNTVISGSKDVNKRRIQALLVCFPSCPTTTYSDETCFSIYNMHLIRQNHKLNVKLAGSISIRFCPNYLKLIAEFLER